MKYKSSNKRIKSKKGINSITSLLNLFDSSKDRTNQYISNESIQKYKDTLYKGNWFVYKDDILKQLSLKSTYKELYNNFIQNYNLDSNVYTYNSFYISIYRWGIYYSEHTAKYYNILNKDEENNDFSFIDFDGVGIKRMEPMTISAPLFEYLENRGIDYQGKQNYDRLAYLLAFYQTVFQRVLMRLVKMSLR